MNPLKTTYSHLFAIVLFFIPCFGLAQESASFTQTVRGTISDFDTKASIPGATVIILGSSPLKGAITDPDGKFKIEKVPIGRQTIQVSFLGYETQTLSNVLVGTGKELVLKIELTESITALEEVVITAGSDNKAEAFNEMATVSARSFSVEETKRFAAGISDPARMITAYAGVTGNGGDDQNAIVIRGNSPRGLLWRLEGMEIPNPNHFASEGTSSGGISILSSNTLARSDFFTGAFPAEFGNALSGAFDIMLRNGNNEKRETALQASVLGLEAALEGPINDKGASYLINYRYSTLALFTRLGINIIGEDQENTYQDGAYKIFLPSKKLGDFSFYGIGGLSSDSFKPTGGSLQENTDTDIGVSGMSHLYRINKDMYLLSGLAYSATRVVGNSIDNNPGEPYSYVDRKTKEFWRASTKLRTKFNAKNILEIGSTYSRLKYNFVETEQITSNGNTERQEYFNQKGNSFSIQGYASWKHRFSENLSLINGFHLLHFGLNGKTAIEPRSALKWQFKANQSLSAGFGVHSRIESLEYYLGNYDNNGVITQPNRNLGFTKARHYVLSYDNVIGNNWYFKAETYLQQLYNVPVSTDPNFIFSSLLLEDSFEPSPLENTGTGTNYGLELTVQRFFTKDFYLLFSASLYEAKYKAKDGVERNTPFNSNFGFNLLLGKEFVVGSSGQNLIGFNLRTTWGGNKRFIPIDLSASRMAGSEILDSDNSYVNRHPDFFKTDFQFSFRKNKKNVTHEMRIEILNLTNRRNVSNAFYNNNIQNVEFDYQTRIIPGIGYRIEF